MGQNLRYLFGDYHLLKGFLGSGVRGVTSSHFKPFRRSNVAHGVATHDHRSHGSLHHICPAWHLLLLCKTWRGHGLRVAGKNGALGFLLKGLLGVCLCFFLFFGAS